MSDYTPVNSKLFDRLRATATLDRECHLTYLDSNGEKTEVRGRIVDVYSTDEAEWCKLDSDEVIRLVEPPIDKSRDSLFIDSTLDCEKQSPLERLRGLFIYS